MAAFAIAALMCGMLAVGLCSCQQEQTSEVTVGLPDEDDPALLMSLPSIIDVDRIGWLELPATCDPETIEVGIPCGMLEMCGQDPCLCGAVDEYGACACNGTEWVTPTFTVEFEDEGIATTVEAFGKTYLVPLASGTVDAVVTAELPHHQPSQAHVQVHVKGMTFIDIAKVAGALALVAAVAAGLFFGIRGLARAMRRAARSAAGAVRQRRERGAKPLRGLDGGARGGAPDRKEDDHG